MKKNIILAFLGVFLLFASSCDPGGKTTTEIINKSSYDLQIGLESNYKTFDDINLLKGETASFELHSRGGYPEPKYEIDTIIFTDFQTGETIKIWAIQKEDDYDIFELLNVERTKHLFMYRSHAFYTLTITDDLLR